MRPLTETTPKPMIPVAGKPFLQHQVELLCAARMQEILLLVAYLGEQIESYFGDGAGFGCAISYWHESTPLGTGGALKNAEAQLRDTFLVVNGDTYLPIDYQALHSSFAASDCAALIVAYEKTSADSSHVPANSLPHNLGVLPGGSVFAYRKRDPAGLTHTDAGAVVLHKSVLQWLPEGCPCSLEEEIYPRLIARGQMRAWITSQPFYDIGSPAGLAALEKKLH
jgi:NDP-sugar pyrophosphorylase family protein